MDIKAKLFKMEDMPIPQGHVRRNKGATTYFFSVGKTEQVKDLLRSCGLEDKGQMHLYEKGVHGWYSNDESKMAFLCAKDNENWISVSIFRWQ